MKPQLYIIFNENSSEEYKSEMTDDYIERMNQIINKNSAEPDLELIKKQFKDEYILIYGPTSFIGLNHNGGNIYYWLNEDKFIYFKDTAYESMVTSTKEKSDFSKLYTILDERIIGQRGLRNWRKKNSVCLMILVNAYKEEAIDKSEDKFEEKPIDEEIEMNKNEDKSEDKSKDENEDEDNDNEDEEINENIGKLNPGSKKADPSINRSDKNT